MKLTKNMGVGIGIGAAILIGLVVFLIVMWTSAQSNGSVVYVQSVASLMGYAEQGGLQNRYAGVVEAQQTVDIQKDGERTVTEVLVKEGDVVTEGDVLFLYDTQEANFALEQALLELERIENSIHSYYAQIAQLEQERKTAPASEQLSYTMQIQQAQSALKTEEYNQKVKQLALEALQANAVAPEVKAPLSGVVQQVNNKDDQSTTGQAFISIMETGDYRVKGFVNEQNVFSIQIGDAVTIRSRADDSQTWYGAVGEINTQQNQQGEGNDPMTTSSRYPFYITLENDDNLLMGQHVYIELGQGLAFEEVQIQEGYLTRQGDDFYVWVEHYGELRKRQVQVGDYEEATGMYTIAEGLTLEDRVAFPQAGLQEGDHTMVYSLPVSDTTSQDLQPPETLPEETPQDLNQTPETLPAEGPTPVVG